MKLFANGNKLFNNGICLGPDCYGFFDIINIMKTSEKFNQSIDITGMITAFKESLSCNIPIRVNFLKLDPGFFISKWNLHGIQKTLVIFFFMGAYKNP